MNKIELLENEFLDSNGKIVHLNDLVNKSIYKQLNDIFLGLEGIEMNIITLEFVKNKVKTMLIDIERTLF